MLYFYLHLYFTFLKSFITFVIVIFYNFQMNLNERISKVIEFAGLTSSEFADEIEVQRSSISHITSGRNKPSLDFLIKVKDKFPVLQWDWLINGDGEMLITDEKKEEKPKVEEKTKPTSLPDLFSLIDDDNFGITESEDTILNEAASNPSQTLQSSSQNILNDSQRLETEEISNIPQGIENQKDKVKRVILFFESGKFESYEL